MICRERGLALLAVLVLALAVAGSAASFAWLMNQQQARAGAHFRTAAALAAAEAGVHRSLAILEGTIPDGHAPDRAWRPDAYTQSLPGALEGRFTVSLTDDADGAIVITSVGDVAGASRRLRARVYLASPALLAALYGAGAVSVERPPATLVILPYGAGTGDRPWVHIAAGRGIEFASPDASINNPSAAFEAAPGPVDAPEGTNGSPVGRAPGPVRLLLAGGAELTLGRDHFKVDIQQLRAAGVYVDGVLLPTQALPAPPEVDRAYYQAMASRNTSNGSLNGAAGKYLGDDNLLRKRDSLYTWTEFERLIIYLRARGLSGPLRGAIYVKDGGVSLLDGQQLRIVDGTLVAESTVEIAGGASLEILHSAATRTLPGLLVLDTGAIVVTQGARLRVHGLVYAAKTIDAGLNSRTDIVGAVLDRDPEFSFRSFGASVVIRYDPAVLGTPGLRVPGRDPVVGWIAAWEELP